MHSVGMGWIWIIPILAVVAGGAYAGWRALRHRNRSVGATGEIEERGPDPEARIYALAKEHGGRLTVSQVVVSTGVSPKRAEELLESMTDNLRVRMDVTEEGRVVYEFPELKE